MMLRIWASRKKSSSEETFIDLGGEDEESSLLRDVETNSQPLPVDAFVLSGE
jgi:hypothetical protein